MPLSRLPTKPHITAVVTTRERPERRDQHAMGTALASLATHLKLRPVRPIVLAGVLALAVLVASACEGQSTARAQPSQPSQPRQPNGPSAQVFASCTPIQVMAYAERIHVRCAAS